MVCFEQEDRAIGEYVGGRRIVGGFYVARRNNAQLLVSFVEVAFCDPVNASDRWLS